MFPFTHPLKLVLLAVAAQSLGACASLTSNDPPICDGRHRRPANAYGSILTPPPVVDQPGTAAQLQPPAPADSQPLTDAATAGGCT